MLLVEELVEGADPPGAARLRADLRRWLSRLAPDVPWDLATAPVYRWGRQGWSITFRAIPLAPDKRGLRPNHRAIGVYGHAPVQFIDHAPAIRKAVMSKHHQYGDLDAPFVVAVGTYIHETDRWHTTNAMYGALAFQLGRDATGETVTRPFRCDDGYFGAPPQWQHRNVSGVLIVNQLMPSHVQRADVAMWRHPDPLHPLPQNLGLPAHNLTPATDGTLNDTPPAPTAEEFFGLPSPWPPGEPWPR
jgi:hypothetical protein